MRTYSSYHPVPVPFNLLSIPFMVIWKLCQKCVAEKYRFTQSGCDESGKVRCIIFVVICLEMSSQQRAFIDYFEDTWHLILNETVSRQNLWEGNIAKYKTSEGNCALLPAIWWRTTAVTARFSEFPSSKCPASGKIEITKYLFHLIFALFPIYFFTPSFSQLLFVPLLSCVKVKNEGW